MHDPSQHISLFSTVVLGTCRGVEELRRALLQSGSFISKWALELLANPLFSVRQDARKAELVNVSLADLGFTGRVQFRDIYARASALNLEVCPPDVGPQLRLDYSDQPLDEGLIIGMDPLKRADGVAGVFVVEHRDSGLWLGATGACPTSYWFDQQNRWIFCRPGSGPR